MTDICVVFITKHVEKFTEMFNETKKEKNFCPYSLHIFGEYYFEKNRLGIPSNMIDIKKIFVEPCAQRLRKMMNINLYIKMDEIVEDKKILGIRYIIANELLL